MATRKHTRAPKSDTPLARWLARTGTSQRQFAETLGKVRGVDIAQSHVAKWVAGRAIPTKRMRMDIFHATGRQVLPEDWDDVETIPYAYQTKGSAA